MTGEKCIETPMPCLTIPREKAIFWMDGQGRWHNQHGPFEHKKIIDHFNASIARDSDGYYVNQENNGILEKVYFRYEDTALFIVDLVMSDPVKLVLNTSVQIELQPDAMLVSRDQLYIHSGDHRIKFGQRALMKISPMLEHRNDTYYICVNEKQYPIHME
jgi:hypothetical protein